VTIRFLEIAEIELDEAVRWYDGQAQGLGTSFLIEVLSSVTRIADYPDAWPSLGPDLRRCRLTRFPYGLIYALENGDIVVVALAHLHREPDYWRDRLRKD
jgi:hypothetical protein